MTTLDIRTESALESAAPPEPRKSRPIVAWAVFGVVFLTIEMVALTGWVVSGDAQRTPTGPTPVPTWMKWSVHGQEVAGLVFLAVFLYFFLVKPWRRERRITTDGLFCLVFFTMFWQDTILNFFQPWFTYNAEMWNLGAWNPHIVGWLSPNANRIAEPLIWDVPVYVYGVLGMMVFGCWVMRKAKARWPHLSNAALLGVCFAVICVIDLVAELVWLRTGVYTYPGSIEWLTIFHGHYYQFPLYEIPMVGVWGTTLTAMRYFTNDKDETIAERGLEKLRVTRKSRTGVRFLALAGGINVAFLTYMIPGSLVGLYSSPWPAEIQNRSYFTDGLCGPGTTYSCSGPAIPIPRPDSAHLNPAGELVVPEGTKLPSN